MTGFPLATVARMMRFWMVGPLPIFQLHAEVAARHHDAAGGVYDAVDVIDTGAVFDFCDDRNERAERFQLRA